MKVYLAGQMSGIAQFNFPRFDEVAEELRNSGFDVVSPAEMDAPEIRALAMASVDGAGQGDLHGQTWGDFLSRDVKLVADEVEGIVLMDDWQISRGANLEAFVALLSGKQFWIYSRAMAEPFKVSARWVWDELREYGVLDNSGELI